MVSCETPQAAATRRSGSFCSTTRCSTVGHSEGGRLSAGCFGLGCMTLRHRDRIDGTDLVASEQKNGRERHGRGTRSQVKPSLDLSGRFNPVEHPRFPH
jgi:hypothetical protein